MDRDPTVDPREGDELRERAGARVIYVDMVKGGEVFYRVVRGVALLAVSRLPLETWREQAPGVLEVIE